MNVNCIQCGVNLIASDLRGRPRKTCSASCAARRKNAMRKPSTRQCAMDECANTVEARNMCRIHYRRWARANGLAKSPSDGWTDRRRANHRKRQALAKGATSADPVVYADVYKRDENVCGICLTPIDPLLTWPHPQSPSIDHIIPLSRGGQHTYENVQSAHLQCNVRKGARVA